MVVAVNDDDNCGATDSNITIFACRVLARTSGDTTVFGTMGTFVNRTPCGGPGVPGLIDEYEVADNVVDGAAGGGGGTIRMGV